MNGNILLMNYVDFMGIFILIYLKNRFLHDKKKSIVWTKNGQYIGDCTAFARYVKNTYGIECDIDLEELQDLTDENLCQSEWLKQQAEARKNNEKKALIICGIQNEYCPTGPRSIKGVNAHLIDRINWTREYIEWDLVIIVLYTHELSNNQPIEDDVNQKIYARLYREDTDKIIQFNEEEFDFLPILPLLRDNEIKHAYFVGQSIDNQMRKLITFIHASFFDVTIIKNASAYSDNADKNKIRKELEEQEITFIPCSTLPHKQELIDLG